MTDILNGVVLGALDTLAPFSPSSGRPRVGNREPWRTVELRALEKLTVQAFKKYRRSNHPNQLFIFRDLRRRAARLYSDLLSAYIRDSIVVSGSQAETWRILSRLGIIGEEKRQAQNISPSDFADFLMNLPGGPDPRPDFGLILEQMDTGFDEGRFYFGNISTEGVIREVLRLGGYRAIGPDGIHMRQIVDGLEVLAPLLADLFNAILNSGSYPEAWKRSTIKMVPKRLNPTACSDHMPISLHCTPAKVFEGIILCQITDYLEGKGFFYEKQFGFRRRMSCEFAVLDLVEGMRKDIFEGKAVWVALEDFTVAFNCMFGSVIVEQMIEAGFSRAAAAVIADSLTGRSFRVVAGRQASDWTSYHRGIGQGGRLGPILYIMGANTYPRAISRSCKCHLLADDSTVEHACFGDNLPAALDTFQGDLLGVEEWCRSTGLVLNPRKVVFVCFGTASAVAAVRAQSPEIVVGGKRIGLSREAKYLGVWLTEDLS